MKLFVVLLIGFSVAALAAAAAKPEAKKTSAAAGAERKRRLFFLGKLLAGGVSAISKSFNSVGLALGGSDEQPQPAQQIVLVQAPPKPAKPILLVQAQPQMSYPPNTRPPPPRYPPHPHPTSPPKYGPHPHPTYPTKYALQPSPPKQQQPCPVPLFPGGCLSGQVCAMVAYGQHQCVPQHADGASCVTNFECMSGTCHRKHCATDECRSAGQQSWCPKGQECVTSDSGNKCVESETSSECPMPLSMLGCGEMQYCTVGINGNVCTSKLPVNSRCRNLVECLSGSCRHGKCNNDACPMLDASNDCMPTQYCTSSKDGNMCVGRKENGARCSVGTHCESGVCEHGVCVQDDCWKPFTQDGCQPSYFCSPGQKGNTCAMRKTPGTGCQHPIQCQSHVCRHNICVADQCSTPLTTDRCDVSTEFCMSGATGNKCVTKLDNGMVCKVISQCMSNNCDMGMCMPKGPVRLSNGEICSLGTECASLLCVVKRCAETQMSVGGRCLTASDCQSLICTNKVCVAPETTTPPTTTPQTTTMTTTTATTTTTPKANDTQLIVCDKCNVAPDCDIGTCAAAGTFDPCGCPDGFTLCAGRCLSLLSQPVMHTEAEEACAGLGAHLVTPRSEEEQQCVVDIFGADPVGIWLGYRGGMTEESFVGADGCGGISYSNWRTGEPAGNSNDNCVGILSDGLWVDGDFCSGVFGRTLCQLADCYRPECGQQ